jgi:UDP-glucose 4-epimerase
MFGVRDKVAIAIDRLRYFEPEEGYYLCFSGGKDSQVIYHLAKEAGVKHFIFMSTSKVFGKYEEKSIWNEFADCNPSDFYGLSKYQAEKELSMLVDNEFQVSIVRTPVVYGPENKANMSKLIKLIRFVPLLPLGNSKNKRHFNYIENLVSFLDKIIEARLSGVFISMDKEAVSTTELVYYISEALNKNVVLVSLPTFVRKIASALFPENYERLFGSFIMDNAFTRKSLNYNPVFSTREGICRTLNTNAPEKSE